jgi:hypothetical protein
MPFKESETFPEAFDRFEKWMKGREIQIKSNNDLLTHFMTWGSIRGVNYTPMTKLQIQNIQYEAKQRRWGFINRIIVKLKGGKERESFRDMQSGKFAKREDYEKSIS